MIETLYNFKNLSQECFSSVTIQFRQTLCILLEFIMAWLSKQLGLQQKKPLVSGYIREECDGLLLLVPSDLIKIIRWYLDEVLYWSMHGKFLNKFCAKKVGQILYSSTYNYGDIEFCNYWYPNGNSKNYADQVIFGVTLCKLPKYIKSLTIYYRLQCHVFNCVWKSIHTFNQSTAETNNCIGWNPFNVKLSKCKKKNRIDFNCYVNVVRIIYDDEKEEMNRIDTDVECIEPYYTLTKYQWILSDKQIKECHQCLQGKTFYSDNFGSIDNYCLFVAPKGFNQDTDTEMDMNKNHLMLYLRLLRLPINIKSMSITYTIKAVYTLNGNGIEYKVKESQSTKIGYGFTECTKQCLINKVPNIMFITSLSFAVRIEIEELIDMNNKTIPKPHWQKFGIVLNDNFSKIKNLTNWF